MDELTPHEPPAAPPHPLLRLRLAPILLIALAGLVGVPAIGALAHVPPARSGLQLVVIGSFIIYGALLGWLAVALPRAGVSWRRLFGSPVPLRCWVEMLAIVWMHVSFASNSFVLLLVVLLDVAPRFTHDLLRTALANPLGGTPSPLLAVIIVVIAPVVEELLFRGVLLQRFALRWGAGRAILLTSVVFALLHPFQPLGLFVFSLLLSVLFFARRSLWAPIAAHAMTNGALLLVSRGADERPSPFDSAERLRALAPIALPALALATVVVAIYLWGRWPRPGQPIPYDDPAFPPATEGVSAA